METGLNTADFQKQKLYREKQTDPDRGANRIKNRNEML